MRSITAVELGADICALARTSVRGSEIRLTAAEILDPAAFPGIDAFTLAVRQTRTSLRLPRKCRVVVWGLPDGASRRDAVVKPLIAPLTAAGFRIDRVVSPCNALAALARRMKTSRGQGSTCWIAINRGGVAIVVVRPGKLLYSHSFAWDSSVGSSGSQARLLQRYSLVAFLAPEIKRAMAESLKYGTPVDAVVTCGNLPELRSLTMPLIEEVDVEVETLDSLDGLVVKPLVAEKLAEWAPAIRIACAAAIARGTRPWDPSKKTTPWHTAGTYARAAALAAAVAGIGYLWYVRFARPKTTPAPPVVSAPATASKSNPAVVSAPATAPKSASPVVSAPPAAPKPAPPAGRTQSTSLPPDPASAKATAGPPTQPPLKATAGPPEPYGRRPKPSAKAEGRSYMAGSGANAPALSDSAKKPQSKGAVSVPAPAVSDSAKRAESNPKRPESDPPAPRPSAANAANTIPRARMQPLVTVPSPNTPAPKSPAPPSTLASAPAPGVIARAPAPRPTPPAVIVPAKPPELDQAPPARPPAAGTPPPPVRPTSAALNPPVPAADKLVDGVVRSPSPAVSTASDVRPVTAALRGPMPALLKDAVPRVTAILVAADRRFATVDGGQIIGIGDLLGRRTVVGMDERSVVLQEPSGVQIRIGLGGRLLGVERAAR